MPQLAELLPPRPEPQWQLLKQCGVDQIVGLLNGGEQDQRMFASVGAAVPEWAIDGDEPWGLDALRRNQALFAEHGFELVALEDTAPMDKVRLGLPGRDEQIEQVITQVRAMGELGIGVLCYNWMALTSWGRTDIAIPARGGALVTGYNAVESESREPLAPDGAITHDQLWEGLEYFVAAVVPEAEAAGVRLGLHPDDPPRTVTRGVPRIMGSVAAFRRVLGMSPSTANGTTFCQGNYALMPEIIDGETDLPTVIREFGADKIPFVHFRDVRGTVDDFRETFHDEGQNDMPACMRAYAEIGFDGPMRPDHVPTMAGEPNTRPGYEYLGRLFALGYTRGLMQASWTK